MRPTPVAALLLTAALFAGCGPVTAGAPGAGPGPGQAAPPPATATPKGAPEPAFGMVIHGGAGTIRREALSAEQEAAFNTALTQALQAGHGILAAGGTSLDAVVAAVRIMEDSPLFNAGRGAVFTAEGTNELDAAIMDGATLNAGAVAGIKHVRNPITLARAVMEHSPHVMMIGEGAETFARERGLEFVPAEYFFVQSRWDALQRVRAAEAERRPGSAAPAPATPALVADDELRAARMGTVGAVALDRHGNLAAATSTGGMTNKRFGRVGDVPVIGAGTYANNASCAVSATGHGEYFIRYTVAHDICARMQYRGMSLRDAAHEVVMGVLVEAGGDGGVIAMDRQGNWTMPFNSAGMYRGRIGADGRAEVAIFRE
jgi:L-asparaginase / beta-aspartyl-peptidase